MIKVYRQPTKSEIAFGYGAIHYAEIERARFLRKNGTLKRWIKSPYDGLRYYRY